MWVRRAEEAEEDEGEGEGAGAGAFLADPPPPPHRSTEYADRKVCHGGGVGLGGNVSS